MSSPKVPTRIVDVNGKETTVHKNAESSTAGSQKRVASLATPVAQQTPAELAEIKLDRALEMLESRKTEVDITLESISKIRADGFTVDYFKIAELADATARERAVHRTIQIIENARKDEMGEEDILALVTEDIQRKVESWSGAGSSSVMKNEVERTEHEFYINMLRYFRDTGRSSGF